jgi:hypothetical protein
MEVVTVADTDEKENKRDYDFERSFDSTITSNSSPGSLSTSVTPRARASTIVYNNVLSLLSDEARQAVEAMVESIKRKVMDEARREVCKRSFEEGRKVGRIEGRILGMEGSVKNSDAPHDSAT